MDQDLWLKALYFHGPSLLNSIVNDSPVDLQNISKRQQIHQFIKNKHQLLFQERSSVFKESSSFNYLPTEIFWDCSIEQRRKLFFKNLERGHILILKVINDSLQDNYKLQVLAKYQCCMKIDDLSLIMYLPKLGPELQLAGEGLSNYDLIRAAVCSCSINERKLFVTIDSTILDDDADSVKLGKVSVDELPSYVGDIQVQQSSYKAYYHQTAAFRDPNWANQLNDALGLKKNYLYSFHKEWDGKTYPPMESGQYLQKKHSLMLSNTHYNKAVEFFQAQEFTKAIASLNFALTIYPQNKRALLTRGTLYANSNNLRKAFFDTEQALNIDPLYEPAQKQMSLLLVAAAKAHMQQNDIQAAKDSLSAAIGLDDTNEEATKTLLELETMKQPVPEITLNSSASSEKSIKKSKKKKKKHHKNREKGTKRKLHRHRSRSRSPKWRRTVHPTIPSVIQKP